MITIDGIRYEIDNEGKTIRKIESMPDSSERISLEIPVWSVLAGARSMRYFVQNLGRFNAKMIAGSTFNIDRNGKKAESDAQDVIDYVVSLGLIQGIGRGFYEATCWIDDDVLIGVAA